MTLFERSRAAHCVADALRLGRIVVGLLALMVDTGLAAQETTRLQLPEHPRVRTAPVPSWVERLVVDPAAVPAAREPQTSAAAGEDGPRGIDYLLSDYQIRVPAEGTPIEFQRWVARVADASGLGELASWSLELQPEFETLLLHRVAVHRAESWSDRADSRTFLAHREQDLERRIVDRRMTLALIIDDLRVGDVVDIAYSIQGKNPQLGEHYAGSAWLRFNLPTRRLHVRVDHDRSVPLSHRIRQGGPEPTESRLPGRRVLSWDLSDVGASEWEPNAPDGWLFGPWVELSTFAGWEEVASWGQPLYRQRTGLDAELRSAIREWRQLPELERVVRARDWVQENVRYMALLVGPHSLAPHALEEIVRRRYGDCKDKAILLTALLEASGVEAWPLLVHSERGWDLDQTLPSPFAFDHVIVAARVDGAEVWIDPTLRLQGGAALEQMFVPPYGWGLPIRSESTGLAPEPEGGAGGVEVAYRYRLDDDLAEFDLEVDTVRRGAHAERMRADIETRPATELQDSYLEYYRGLGYRTEVTGDLEVSDDRAANAVRVTERYHMTPDDEAAHGSFETLPMELVSVLSVPEPDAVASRRAPWALPHPMSWRERMEIAAPPEWDLAELERQVIGPGFRFTVTSEPLEAGGIAVDYRFDTTADRVEVAELTRFVEAMETVESSLVYAIEDTGDGLLPRLAGVALALALFGSSALAIPTLRWLAISGVWREGRR